MLLSEGAVSEGCLIIGADGLIGGALLRHCRERAVPVSATSFLPLEGMGEIVHFDLTRPESSWPALPQARAAILCAAITNLEQCRRDPAGSRFVNVDQTLRLASALVRRGTFVVFISSNLVFDGSKPFRKAEEPTCPTTEYGRQKADAEAGLVATLGENTAVVRLTKVVHPEIPLLKNWRQALGRGESIQAFSDFVCSPISLEATVSSIASVALNRLGGVWQLSAADDISYSEIAVRMVERCGLDLDLVRVVSSRANSRVEHLPQYTTLDASRAQQRLGFELQPPLKVIDDVFR